MQKKPYQNEQHQSSWIVWKVGGSCLSDSTSVSQVIQLVLRTRFENTAQPFHLALVLSAFQGITQQLHHLSCTESYPQGVQDLDALIQYHQGVCLELLKRQQISPSDANHYFQTLQKDQKFLQLWLKEKENSHHNNPSMGSIELKILTYGELWSSKLLFYVLKDLWVNTSLTPVSHKQSSLQHTTHLSSPFTPTVFSDLLNNQTTDSPVQWLDTRDILIIQDLPEYSTASSYLTNPHAKLDHSKSQFLAHQWLHQHSQVVVLPGFICRTDSGKPWILGWNSGDFTAALFANYLRAKEFVIYKHVEAIYSVHPQFRADGVWQKTLSYGEAINCALYGVKALHAPTILYCEKNKIPILIRKLPSLHPQDEKISTLISSQPMSFNEANPPGQNSVLSVLQNVGCVQLEESIFRGFTSLVLPKIQAALNHKPLYYPWLVSPIMENQSLDIVLPLSDMPLLARVVSQALDLKKDYDAKFFSSVTIQDLCILCIVHENIGYHVDRFVKLKELFLMNNIKLYNVFITRDSHALLFILSSQDAQRALEKAYSAIYINTSH